MSLAVTVNRGLTVRITMSTTQGPIDGWMRHPCPEAPTHRPGMGAATIGAMIYVAGGPVMGGSVQSALHEAFTLGPA